MKSKRVVRDAFLSLLPAQILASLIPVLTGIINGLVVGNNFSSNAIAAIGFFLPMSKFLAAIVALFSIGSQIVAANLMGTGDLKKVNKTYSTSIECLVILGTIFTLIGLLLTTQLAHLLGVNEAVFAETSAYIRGLSIGFIPCITVPLLMVFLQLSGDSTNVVVASGFNAVSNLILDIVALNVFKGNMFGIGFATSISQILTMLFLIYRIHKAGFVKFNLCPIDFGLVKDIGIKGINAMILNLFHMICTTIIVRQVDLVGGIAATSATSILFSSCGIIDCMTVGIMSTTSTVASLFAGEENEFALKETAKNTCLIGETLGLIGGILYFAFAKQIALAFGASDEVLPLAVTALRLYAVFFMVTNPFAAMTNFYQSLGRVFLTFMFNFVAIFSTKVIFTFVLGSKFGAPGIWSTYLLSAIVGTLLMVAVALVKSIKQKRGGFDLVWYNEGKSFSNTLSVDVKNYEDLTKALDDIENFCTSNGVAKDKMLLIRLATEENVSNILDHGFTKSKKKNLLVQVFVGIGNDNVRLIFHDNSVPFDPQKRFTIIEHEEASLKGAGIKIVNKLAKNLSYQFSFGMNVLMLDM